MSYSNIQLDSKFEVVINNHDDQENDFIFNLDLYSDKYLKRKKIKFQLVRNSDKRVFGTIVFYPEGDSIYSPIKATFGSFNINNKLSYEIQKFYIDSVISHLKKKYSKIIIITPPPIYAKNSSEILNFLFLNNFIIKKIDLDYYFDLKEIDFIGNLNYGSRQNYKQMDEKNFNLSINDLSLLESSFNIINENKLSKDRKSTISLSNLKSLFKYFPEKYYLFSIQHDDEIVCASIVVSICSKVAYLYSWANNDKYKSISPSTYLTNQMIIYFFENNYDYLDMGIATELGIPNFGLMNFKRKLGSKTTTKFTLEYEA